MSLRARIRRFATSRATRLPPEQWTVAPPWDPANPPVAGSAYKLQVRYTGFASHLFDYFTVTGNPNDDYLPATPGTYLDHANPDQRVANGPSVMTTANANNHNEDTTPVHGLININTAPSQVLAQFPGFRSPPRTSATANPAIALAIVNDRLQHGPFRTLYDLLRVEAVRDPSSVDPTYPNFSTATAAAIPTMPAVWGNYLTPLQGDFLDRYVMLDRVSNLITTRSDWLHHVSVA